MTRMPPNQRPTGFTLLEVIVALTVASMVVGMAATILFSLRTRVESLAETEADASGSANAERLIRSLLANLDMRARVPLEGDESNVVINTWCRGNAAWLEPCRVQLIVSPRAADTYVVLRSLSGLGADGRSPQGSPDSLSVLPSVSWTLWRTPAAVRLIYLSDPRGGGMWAEQWRSIHPPRGLGLVMGSDTLFAKVWGVV